MKERVISVLKKIFSCVIAICMITARTVFGAFVFALAVGGETADWICTTLKSTVLPIVYYTNAVLAVIGVVAVYLSGERVYTMETGTEKSKDGGLNKEL